MLKKLLALVLSMMLLVSVFGFSSALADDIIEIELYQQKAEEADVFTKIIAAFEAENPDIRIKQITMPEAEKTTVLENRVASDDTPDMFTCWWNNSAWMIYEEGVCYDLADTEPLSNVKDFLVETCKYKDGANYFMPLCMNCMGVFYNVDIFEEYGIEIPETQDELWAVCEKLQAAGITPFMCTDKEGWTIGHSVCDLIGLTLPNYLDEFKALYAGKLKGADVTKLDDLANLFLKIREYSQPDTLGTGYDQGVSDFANGKAAMLFQGIWMLPVLNADNPDMNYAMFPFPGVTKEETRILAGTDVGISMAKNQKSPEHEEACLRFLNFLANGNGGKLFAELDGAPSAFKGLVQEDICYQLLVDEINADRSFWWPSETSWGDGTYNEVVIAFQNLLLNEDLEAFHTDFENAFLFTSEPVFYFYDGQTVKEQ